MTEKDFLAELKILQSNNDRDIYESWKINRYRDPEINCWFQAIFICLIDRPDAYNFLIKYFPECRKISEYISTPGFRFHELYDLIYSIAFTLAKGPPAKMPDAVKSLSHYLNQPVGRRS